MSALIHIENTIVPSEQLEPRIADTGTLQCMSSSGMPRPPRINGITTPKEFKAIVDAIAYAKTLAYPMTVDLIQALAGIKRQNDNKRVANLIEAILELNQLHDDIYTDDNRKVYRDDESEYIVFPNGEIDRNPHRNVLSLLKKIEYMKRKNLNNNKSVLNVSTIVYTTDFINTFINLLLSSSFLCSIPNGVFCINEPIKFYRIDAYEKRVNTFGIDAKYEKHRSRLIQHLLGAGLDKNMIFDLRAFSEDIGMLFGYVALKHLPQYKRNLNNSRSITTHGNHLLNLYIQSSSKSGYVSSRSNAIHYFSHKTLVSFHIDLFERKRKFMRNNQYYIVYEPNDVLSTIGEEVFDFVRTLTFREPPMQIQETNDIFSFNFNDMMEIPIRDRMNILAHSIGVKDGRVWVDIKGDHNGFSRVYSLMTAIKSKSRLELHERDMSTGQQTIMMNIVGGSSEEYPLYHRLINDKKTFRGEVMERLECDYDKAKEHITALTNGRDVDTFYGKANAKALHPFYLESQKLVDAFIDHVKENDKFVYDQALTLAKEAKKDDFAVGGKRKYGVLFHCYTHYERQIREAMKSCYTMPVYDVHDAVYSREEVDTEILEKAVLEQTGFKVKIE